MNADGYDPFDVRSLADPYPEFADFVEHQPVFWSPPVGAWVVSRHTDVRLVLRDHVRFSASNALAPITPPCPHAVQALAAGGFRPVPTLTNADPPAHTRARRIAQSAFAPRRVARMEPFVRRLVRRFVGERLTDGRADMMAALTWELPALVLFEIMGVPPGDVATIKRGGHARLRFMFGRASEPDQVEAALGMAEFWRYCEALADDRRRARRDDFTSELVHTPDPSGRPLDQQEIATVLFGLLLAGHETTTNLMNNALRRLLEESTRWGEIAENPLLIANAVEEVLRFDSPVIHWRRKTKVPVTIHHVELPGGADVLACIGAANRDPDVFSDPHRFDIHRPNAHQHLSFGAGPHLCLGAPLARLETRIVLEELSAALPGLRLADQDFDYSPMIAFRGPRALHVECDSALAASPHDETVATR
jgi:cytochrome P450